MSFAVVSYRLAIQGGLQHVMMSSSIRDMRVDFQENKVGSSLFIVGLVDRRFPEARHNVIIERRGNAIAAPVKQFVGSITVGRWVYDICILENV